jgi:RNA polymerase sigma-70 factor (ECF subfamily)
MRTSVTLLGSIRRDPRDQAAWARLVKRYGKSILGWARACKLQQSDAEEVTQLVLVKLLDGLPRFEYDPARGRFRDFLRTVTRNALRDYIRRQKTTSRGSGDTGVLQSLAEREAEDTLVTRLEKEFDLELKEEAFRLVQRRVEPHNWQVFQLREVEGLSGEVVAERVGMSRLTVYGVAKRVKDMIAREIAKLEARELEKDR